MPPIPAFRRNSAPRLGGERQRGRETDRPSRVSRGYNAEWVEIREAKKRLCKGLCEECLRRGYLHNLDVIDHIIPVDDAPELRLSIENTQGLCHRHHNGWKRLLEAFARATNAVTLLPQWCLHPETRPAHFQIMKFGPVKAGADAQGS